MTLYIFGNYSKTYLIWPIDPHGHIKYVFE